MDSVKEKKTKRERTIASKNKRSQGKYETIRKARADQAKAASEGRDYGDDCQQRWKKEAPNNCIHAIFGYTGLGGYKTSKSTKCAFHQVHGKINDKSLGQEGIKMILIREGLLKNDFLQNGIPICEENVVVRHAPDFFDVNGQKPTNISGQKLHLSAFPKELRTNNHTNDLAP
jgi:hypothetical protein